MRADRLVAATLYLQRRGTVTAAELAAHLEVSVATARRDLEALSSAGVPVYPQRGRGGGWQLVGGARTDLTGLTETEVRDLFLALAPLNVAQSASVSAVAKLVRAVPAPFREQAEVAMAAIRQDGERWQHRRVPEPAALAPLREAVLQRHRCTIEYRRRGAQGARLTAVEPWRLVDKAGVSYLLAGTERGPRTYRLDRVTQVVVDEGSAVERPDDATLDELWARTHEAVTTARTAVRARIRGDEQALAVLADQFGTAFEATDIPGEAVVAAHTERGLAEQFAGWGSRVRVLDAPGVVAELRTIGAELVAASRD